MKLRCRMGWHAWGRWYTIPVLWLYAGNPVARGVGRERRCRGCYKTQES